MRVVVVTPPSPVVSLAQAKRMMRVEHGDDDALITGFVAAATAALDGPGGWLGRALGRQTLRALPRPDHLASLYRRTGFALPYPATRDQDAIDVSSVTYRSAAGALVTIDPTYSRLDDFGALRFELGALPWSDCELAITYATGTPSGSDSAAPIDPRAVTAIALVATGLYANRESEVIDARAVVASNPMVDDLLRGLRLYA